MKRMMLLLFCLALNLPSSGQTRLTIAHKRYVIPAFKATTVSGPRYSADVSIPGPIGQSSYDLEVRYYGYGMVAWPVSIHIIEGTKDSLVYEQYELYPLRVKANSQEVVMLNNAKYYMYHKKVNITAMADSIIGNLIAHHLFTIPDQQETLAKLKQQQTQLNKGDEMYDCCADNYLVVKLKKQYRSFTWNYLPAMQNQQIPEFADQAKLTGDFDRLIMAVKGK